MCLSLQAQIEIFEDLTPGGLEQAFMDRYSDSWYEKSITTQSLKLSGTINAKDFNLMADRALKMLSSIDLSDVNIVKYNTVNGVLIHRSQSASDKVSVVLPESGVYIIQVSGNSIKTKIHR